MSNKRQTVQAAAQSQATGGGTSQQQLLSGNAPVANGGNPNFL